MKIAVVGTGQIGRQSHIPAALACAGVELTALVDPAVERAREVAREFGVAPAIATDVREVLDRIDGAIIATPNHTHRAIAVACLDAGKPVLIEKPLAHTREDAAAIVEAARAAGVALAVGYCSRFRESVRLLKELLDAGAFGRVRRFVHQAGTAGGWAPLSGYNLDRASTGGGVLVVTGSHFIDRMLHFWGQPDHAGLTDDSEGGPEANCHAVFRWRGGIEGHAFYSKTVVLPPVLLIETDRGLVVLEDNDDAEIVFRPRGEAAVDQVFRRRGRRGAQEDVFRLQIDDFARAHREGRAPLVDGAQGLASMHLIERLYAGRVTMTADWYAQCGAAAPAAVAP
ncbi:MAG: Gfo/Idh/MocA family oxidoreductase [Burkholderiales bacterium]|nr:Gfo/Idh/MocA family oxidoreductase [Burkholderiales bacterium]